MERIEHRQPLKDFLRLVAVALLAIQLNLPEALPARAQTPEVATFPDIYYGREPTAEEKAFSVAIGGEGVKGGSGIVIDANVIITAKHVLNQRSSDEFADPSKIWVYPAGDLSHPPVRAAKVIEIGSESRGNDRAVIILSRPLALGEQINPIKLGEWEMIEDYPLFAIGHGRSEATNSSMIPQVGEMTLKPNSSCGYPADLMIVTQNTEDSETTATTGNGDSGGGLFIKIPKGDPTYKPGYYLLGVLYGLCSGQAESYDENGVPLSTRASGFNAVVTDPVKEEIAGAIEESRSIVNPPTYMPLISKVEHAQQLPTDKLFVTFVANH